MTFKDILVPVFSLPDDEGALNLAAAIANQSDAKVAALIIAVHPGSEYADEAAPLSEVLLDLAKGESAAAAEERAKIVSWISKSPVSFSAHHVTAFEAISRREAIANARLTDLVVMTRMPQNRVRRILFESLLFRSGRPVLLAPSAAGSAPIGKRILIGWKPKREAVRAIHDALPLLKSANEVVVATVDAIPGIAGYGEAPGAEVAVHLARHGVHVEVRNVAAHGRTEGQALIDEARAMEADLIVIGAYGRSRAEEIMFGGVTRELLNHAPPPLFLSH